MSDEKGFLISGIGENVKVEGGTERQNDEGRGRPSLISPFLSIRLSKHLQKGLVKYEAGNWSSGQPFSRVIDGLERHLIAYKLGKREEDHLSAMAFAVMCLIHFEEVGREEELNDLFKLWGLKKESVE